MSKSRVKLSNLSKSYGEHILFQNLNLSIQDNESLSIIGRSGCGKTSLIRIIGGFEYADSGQVLINSTSVKKPSRNAIMVFQDFSQLLPWRSVLGNVAWPLIATKQASNKREALDIATKLLEEVEITGGSLKKYPFQISGGMKQRVAIARSLALQPSVLLLDEPFASVDYLTREKLQRLVIDICERHAITTILVTHNIEEAVTMSTHTLVFKPDETIEIVKNNPSIGGALRRILLD